MPGLRSNGPAVLPDTVPKELQDSLRWGVRRESSAENITHGSTEVNKQPTTRSRKRPLSEINANTGLPSIGVENVSSAQQPSVDCDDSTSMQGESSHSGGCVVAASAPLRSRPRIDTGAHASAPLQPTPPVSIPLHESRRQMFFTPNNITTDKNVIDIAQPIATPRDEAEKIPDLDSEYRGDDYDTKYSKKLHTVMLEREEKYLQPTGTYNTVQVEVSLDDHAELVDWMAEVVYTQELLIDVLFVAVHIMDSVLRLKPMKRKSFQLLGGACIFLASKLEEVQAIAADNIVRQAGNAFRVDDLLKMEIFITAVLDYDVTIPTRMHFFDRIQFAADLSPKEIDFAKYLLELSLHDATFNRFRFSKVAAAAANLARQTLRPLSDPAQTIWNPTLSHYSHYSDEELVDAVYALHLLHGNSSACSFVVATVAKYEAAEYSSVSRLICPRPHDLRFTSTLASYRSVDNNDTKMT